MSRRIDIEALCYEKGLRITEQRRIIARVLSEAEDHPDVEALHARASAIDAGISIAGGGGRPDGRPGLGRQLPVGRPAQAAADEPPVNHGRVALGR